MERLPIALSLAHCGTRVPEEVSELCELSAHAVAAASDEGLLDLCGPLIDAVEVFATTRIARIIVDLDRRPDDRGPDGVIKTHTRAQAPVFSTFPSSRIVEALLNRYYRPFHEQLGRRAYRAIVGLDWHGAVRDGSPRQDRSPVRLRIHANDDVPCAWTRSLAAVLGDLLPTEPTILWRDAPGHITRSAPGGIPWMRIELSRQPAKGDALSTAAVRQALREFSRRIQRKPRS